MFEAFDVVLFAIQCVFAVWKGIVEGFSVLNLTSALFFFFAFYRFILRPILGGDFFGSKESGSDLARSVRASRQQKKDAQTLERLKSML